MKTFPVPPDHATNLYEIYEESAKNFDDRKILHDPHKGDSSYLELHQLVINICANIASLDLKSGDVIGLYISNGVERIAAIVASLKLNLTYVPLDPVLPKPKLEFILRHAGIKAVFLDADGYKDHWQEYDITNVQIYEMKNLMVPSSDCLVGCNNEKFVKAKRDDIFCIIPTSGSTGNSKLVPTTNGSMVNRLEWNWRTFSHGPDDVFCSKTNAMFVDFPTETLVAVLKGHACLFLQRCDVINVPSMLNYLSTYHVTRLVTVPSQLKSMINEKNKADIKPTFYLKLVTTGSEMVRSSLVKSFLETFPGTVLWNMYGLTETAGDATFAIFKSEADLVPYCDDAPIGYPVSNTDVFLVDENGNEIHELNVVGHLEITGLSIFPGYIKTEGENDILTNRNGVDVLKTSDLCYWTKEHGLVISGRKDDTVKVKGFKVNLNEITSALKKSYPNVDAIVITKYNELFSTIQCFAFCSFPDLVTPITATDVQSELKNLLPVYMLPRIIILPELPLQSATGKVDRQKLLELVDSNKGTRQKLERGQITALPKIEQMMHILTDILDVPLTFCDMDKSFFELGGDSLAIVQLYQQLNEYGFSVSIPQIMRANSLKLLVDNSSSIDLQPDQEFTFASFDEITEAEFEIVISGLVEAYGNEPLVRHCAQHHKGCYDSYIRIASEIAYKEFPEYAVVVKHYGKIIAASVNAPMDDARSLDLWEKFSHILPVALSSLMLAVSGDVVIPLYEQGLNILEQWMVYVHPSVSNTVRTYIIIELCKRNVDIARKFSLDAMTAFTSNRAATMIHMDLLGFKLGNELKPKNFQLENGESPFAEMSEDFKVVMMTKMFK